MISLISNKSLVHRLPLAWPHCYWPTARSPRAPLTLRNRARQFILPPSHVGSSIDSKQTLAGHDYADAREQARQMIVGVPKFRSAFDSKVSVSASASARSDSPVYRDAQESVRRMILGKGA